MKKMFNWIKIVPACMLVAILVAPCLRARDKAEVKQEANHLRFGHLVNRFGFNFLNRLDDQKNNVIFSPFSLVTLLNLLYLGIDKQSKSGKQLSDVLAYREFDLSRDEDQIHEVASSVFKSVMESVENNAQIEYHRDFNISISNLVLSNHKAGNLSENFQRTAEKYYQAKLARFKEDKDPKLTKFAEYDLITQPNPVLLKLSSGDQLAQAVNLWIKGKTGGRLDKVLDPKNLDLETTNAILVNAIFFKAAWLRTFSEYLSKNGYFFNDGDPEMKIKVKFMTKPNGRFLYYDSVEKTKDRDLFDGFGIDFKAIEMPFQASEGKEFSMVVILPKKSDELDKLERWLTWQNLRKIYASLTEEKVDIEMPKFNFERQYNAREILERMGINLLFKQGQSGLSKLFQLSESKCQLVDQLVHKAMIDVDENGVEAAATSAIEIVALSAFIERESKKPKEFHADHPFLIVIRHIKSNTSLFMGRINKL